MNNLKNIISVFVAILVSVTLVEAKTQTVVDDSTMSSECNYYLDECDWNEACSRFVGRPEFVFAEHDDNLPNVLIIGTSISIGYTLDMRDILKGKANVYRIPENSMDTRYGLKRLDFWLSCMDWDVIHVNWGLHDLKYEASDERQDVLPKEYKRNLRALFKRLTDRCDHLVWASTTAFPENTTPRRDLSDVVLYNKIAEGVAKKYPQIVIDDQYTPTLEMIKDFDRYIKGYTTRKIVNVHFTPEGYRDLAEQACIVVEQALK